MSKTATEKDKPRFKLCIQLEDEFKLDWSNSINSAIKQILIKLNDEKVQ